MRAAAARAIEEDAVIVMEELTNKVKSVTVMLDLAAATDIVQILCTSFTLLHIKYVISNHLRLYRCHST